MSKKNKFFSPSQMIILTGGTEYEEGTDEFDEAKPNLPDEDDVIVLPDGAMNIESGDVVIPDDSGTSGFVSDEAYY